MFLRPFFSTDRQKSGKKLLVRKKKKISKTICLVMFLRPFFSTDRKKSGKKVV
jgi:hypothetical protein